jgi:hypothetical protein
VVGHSIGGASAAHLLTTDRPVLGAQLGLDPGAVPAERQLLITRTYVAAFLDVHLGKRDRPQLDGPWPGFPEVTRTS